MKFKMVKCKCLQAFANRYPDENRVVFVKRYDGKYRVFNKNASNMLFDRNGNEVLEFAVANSSSHITADEATFEVLR